MGPGSSDSGSNGNKTEMGAAMLEEKHMISILLYLRKSGKSRKIDVYNAVSFNPRMPEKLGYLENAGLITQNTPSGSRSTMVDLTDTGKKVAESLSGIDSIMKDPVKDTEKTK